MIHVADIETSVDFYAALGGRLIFGAPGWALLEFSGAVVGLLAGPQLDEHTQAVELYFTCPTHLEVVEGCLRAVDPAWVVGIMTDAVFGEVLKVRAPGGPLIHILGLDRDLSA